MTETHSESDTELRDKPRSWLDLWYERIPWKLTAFFAVVCGFGAILEMAMVAGMIPAKEGLFELPYWGEVSMFIVSALFWAHETVQRYTDG
jgi:hypothetical protein